MLAAKPSQIATNVVDGDYFETLGIPLLAGRTFNSSDTEKSPEVAVINHKMADIYWPDGNAIGKEVHFQNGKRLVAVIGVAADGKYNTLDEPAHPVMYYALSQHYQPNLMLIVRTQGKPQQWVLPLSEMAASLGIKLDAPPFTSDDVMHFALMIPLLMLGIVIGLGAVALMLAIVGLYGSVFYSVNERKREIGIRVALGAQPIHLVRMFLRHAALISGLGVLAGLLLGIGATIVFQSQFYGIRAVELRVLLPVAIAMVVLSMAIAYAAARPWIKVSPMDRGCVMPENRLGAVDQTGPAHCFAASNLTARCICVPHLPDRAGTDLVPPARRFIDLDVLIASALRVGARRAPRVLACLVRLLRSLGLLGRLLGLSLSG